MKSIKVGPGNKCLQDGIPAQRRGRRQLQMNGGKSKKCQEFEHFGSLFNNKRSSDRDTENRLNQERRAIKQLNKPIQKGIQERFLCFFSV